MTVQNSIFDLEKTKPSRNTPRMNKLHHAMQVVVIIMTVPCIYPWDASDLNRVKLHDEYDVYQALWSRHIIVAEAKVRDVKEIHDTVFFPKESIKAGTQ